MRTGILRILKFYSSFSPYPGGLLYSSMIVRIIPFFSGYLRALNSKVSRSWTRVINERQFGEVRFTYKLSIIFRVGGGGRHWKRLHAHGWRSLIPDHSRDERRRRERKGDSRNGMRRRGLCTCHALTHAARGIVNSRPGPLSSRTGNAFFVRRNRQSGPIRRRLRLPGETTRAVRDTVMHTFESRRSHS